MKAGQTVGIDGMTFSISYTQRMQQELADNDIKFNDNFPQFDYIYPERPERPRTNYSYTMKKSWERPSTLKWKD